MDGWMDGWKAILNLMAVIVNNCVTSPVLLNNSSHISGNYGDQFLEVWGKNVVPFLSDLGAAQWCRSSFVVFFIS